MADEGDAPLPGFEGVEKNLEIDFVPGVGPERGLRLITRPQWDAILQEARCTILDSLSNDKVDSYVLSESSLFVYSHKMILKTCGTTTLLRCIDMLLEIAKGLGMSLEWLSYTRKDFIFPAVQKFPHRGSDEETGFLKERFPNGHAFMMGPLTADHWFVFVADFLDRDTTDCVDRTLDMMMFDIDENVAKLFVKDRARFPRDADVTKASGIDSLLPGSAIQEFCFDPCGYSMNGLLFDAYWTIHITPESHCSYASFETNVRMASFTPLVKAVLAIFRPRKFTMTLFADERGVKALRESPFSQVLTVPLVEAASPAVAGPCVLVSDPNGIDHSYVQYPPASASAAKAAAAPPLGALSSSASSVDAFGVKRPADGEEAAALAAAVAAAAGGDASPTSATAVAVTPVPAPAAAAAAPTAPAPLLSKRAPTVASRLLGGGVAASAAGTAAYVLASKSHTEFQGEYHSLLGNYRLVTVAPQGAAGNSGGASEAGTPRGAATPNAGGAAAAGGGISQAASDALSLPRIKYVVERELSKAASQRAMGRDKLRTESM